MSDSLAIDEVVRRTGLTSRALRFYEARGLITPLRTQSGRRWFGAADLERVHQIVALKKAGLSLGDIKRLFDRKPIDLAALLSAQRDRLADQAREISEATALIDSALSRIGRGEPLDAATLCSLIRDGEKVMTDQAKAWKDVVDRYYTPEQQAEWRNRMADAPEFSQQAYLDKWRALSTRIEAALPLDPASDTALAFVREWFTLLEPFSRNATPAMWEGSARMYADMDHWDGEVDPGFSKTVWDFISVATAAARAAGNDIGPVPSFLRPHA
ncbi:MAG: MerR family transcriptional regulator [Pseudomonadota bacterium]|uniref:MerR family transcriptional regulator n=1 Tax=Sphingomonas sp. ERG5 TaxID=1381597 RepID=UPI00054B2D52|nr:MerR family transcriptional regulator [Sphingomonas sp. ERG5]